MSTAATPKPTLPASLTPAATPPPGVKPDFDHPHDTLYWIVLPINIVCVILPVLFVGLRVLSKVLVTKKFFVEDWFSVAAMLATSAWIGVGNHHPYVDYVVRHQWDVPLTRVGMVVHNAVNLEIFYCPCMLLAKLSVILQIKRIFVRQERDAYYWAVWAVIASTTVFYLLSTLLFIVQCIPREKAWNVKGPGHCMNTSALLLAVSAVNSLSDWVILALPIWAIWRLNMVKKRKLEAIAIFGTGILACVLGTVGIVFRVKLVGNPDFTYAIARVGIYSVAEIALVIMVGCIPAFPKLIQYCTRKITTRGHSSQSPIKPSVNSSESGRSKKMKFLAFHTAKESETQDSGRQDTLAKYMGPEDRLPEEDKIYVQNTIKVEKESA